MRQELNGIKCAYVDCMPSTSLAVLKPYTQEQPQMCRSQVQQLNLSQHQFYYDQRVLPSEHIQHHQQFNGLIYILCFNNGRYNFFSMP